MPESPPPAPASLAFVSVSDLRARLVDEREKKPLVVDVRDSGEREAAIAGALHVPASKIRAAGADADKALDDIVSTAREAGATEIVFHCALSQVRGPACARRLNERLATVAANGAGGGPAVPPPPRVAVLTGGFTAWAAEYEGDAAVTERV